MMNGFVTVTNFFCRDVDYRSTHYRLSAYYGFALKLFFALKVLELHKKSGLLIMERSGGSSEN
jgi:hypothetical protein